MLLLLLLLVAVQAHRQVDVARCPVVKLGEIRFHACAGVPVYSKVYFHDATGENLITVLPDRIYENHGQYVAYSHNNTLYVADGKYDEELWKKIKL